MQVDVRALLTAITALIGAIGVIWKIGNDIKSEWKKEAEKRTEEYEKRRNFEIEQITKINEISNTVNVIQMMMSNFKEEIRNINSETKSQGEKMILIDQKADSAHVRIDEAVSYFNTKMTEMAKEFRLTYRKTLDHEKKHHLKREEQLDEDDEDVETSAR